MKARNVSRGVQHAVLAAAVLAALPALAVERDCVRNGQARVHAAERQRPAEPEAAARKEAPPEAEQVKTEPPSVLWPYELDAPASAVLWPWEPDPLGVTVRGGWATLR